MEPEIVFRAGLVSASIYRKKIRNREGNLVDKPISHEGSYEVKLTRVIDEKGQWLQIGTLRISDIPKAQLVLSKAYEYLVSTTKEMEEG